MEEGILDGMEDGILDGIDDGMLEGIDDGMLDGMDEGILDGIEEGMLDGGAEGAAAARPAPPRIAAMSGLSMMGRLTSMASTKVRKLSAGGCPGRFIASAHHRPQAGVRLRVVRHGQRLGR